MSPAARPLSSRDARGRREEGGGGHGRPPAARRAPVDAPLSSSTTPPPPTNEPDAASPPAGALWPWALAALNVGVFLLQRRDPSLTYRLGQADYLVAHGEPWRLLTASFVHGSAWHLLANTVSLLSIGAGT